MKNSLFLVLFISSMTFGQNSNMFFNADYSFFADLSPKQITFEIKGSPYTTDQYSQGTTTLHGKKGFEAQMRYNTGKEVIEFLDDDGKVKELLRRPYITATFGGNEYLVLAYINGKDEKLGYFNPLNVGNSDPQLLLKPQRTLVKTGFFQGKRIMTYRDDSVYYLKFKDKPAIKITLNKKEILKHLHRHSNDLNTFIDNYDLNLKKEGDVIRLLNYYNSLLPEKGNEKQMRG